MSLRGSETTEAISRGIAHKGIAALPPVARNENRHYDTVSRGERGPLVDGIALEFQISSFKIQVSSFHHPPPCLATKPWVARPVAEGVPATCAR
jgi:hypothetical protein